MLSQDYIAAVLRTENQDVERVLQRIGPDKVRMLHAALGMTTEAAEVLDLLKKHLYYGKALDPQYLCEELGDLMWYMALMLDAAGLDLDTVLSANVAKLRARYPERFTPEQAIQRNKGAEYQAIVSEMEGQEG